MIMADAQQQTTQVKKPKGKVVDTWKTKSWYSVIAPEAFNSKEIGQVVSSDEANLLNRKVKANLGELTGSLSMSNAYTAINFRIREVKGKNAYVEFMGHELAPAYIRTLARRRRSVINYVKDTVTKDNVKYRIKMTVVTGVRISDKGKSAIRRLLDEEVGQIASKTDFAVFSQEILFGKVTQKIYAAIKTIAPIRKIEIHKSEVVREAKAAS